MRVTSGSGYTVPHCYADVCVLLRLTTQVKRDKQIENDLKEQEKERIREEGLRARVSIVNT